MSKFTDFYNIDRIIKSLTEGKFKTNIKDVKGLKRNALPPPPARPIKKI